MEELSVSTNLLINELDKKFLRPSVATEAVKDAIVRGNPGFGGLVDEIQRFFPMTSRLRFVFFAKEAAAMVHSPIGNLPVHIASIHDWLGQLCIILKGGEYPIFLAPAPSEAAICAFLSQIDDYLISLFGKTRADEATPAPQAALAKIFPIPAGVIRDALSALQASGEGRPARISPPSYPPMMTHNGADIYDCRPPPAQELPEDTTDVLVTYSLPANKRVFILGVGSKLDGTNWGVSFISPDGTPDGSLVRNLAMPATMVKPLSQEMHLPVNILPASTTIN